MNVRVSPKAVGILIFTSISADDARDKVSSERGVSLLSPLFAMTQRISLFDMDGTLVDSTAGVIGAWNTFAKTYPGLDVGAILHSNCFTSNLAAPSSSAGSHGIRTMDNLAKWCGITDPELLKVSWLQSARV